MVNGTVYLYKKDTYVQIRSHGHDDWMMRARVG